MTIAMTMAKYLTQQVNDMVHVCGSGLPNIFVLRQDKELGKSLRLE